MNGVDSAQCVCRTDARVVFVKSTLFTSLPQTFCCVPRIILRDITVEQGLGKVVLLAQLKEGCQRCSGGCSSTVSQGLLGEIDSLAVFQMNTEMLHRRVPGVDRKAEEAPRCFICGDVASTLEEGDFINWGLLVASPCLPHLKNCTVAALVYIFAYVFYCFDRMAVLNIDVGFKNFA